MENDKRKKEIKFSGPGNGRYRDHSDRTFANPPAERDRSRARFIIKSNGQTETFSKEKLKRSLLRTGINRKVCTKIADQVSDEIRNGEKTKNIYHKAFSLLKESSSLASVHYSLKKSLLELGPEGHFFENFVSKYFEKAGFQTQVCKTLQGKFVSHEVDCIAIKNKQKFYSECKFHNHAGAKNDIKIALYVKARWDDLKDGPQGSDLSGFYIFSNTAFSGDSITYANGTGLKLMGVNAPFEKSFLDIIKEMKLYPLTSITGLPKIHKNILLSKKFILASELSEDILYKAGLEQSRVNKILEEIKIMHGIQS